MSEDNPPPSQNPFIRFKKHVDSRISNGISFITGNQSATRQQEQHHPTITTSTTTTATNTSASHDMFFGGPPFGGDASFGSHLKVHFWNEWAQVSPYSPYNLRHLPQPVPSDLPAGVDAKSFGFEDAFEDLLAVSGGRQMMDLTKQARMKKDILDHFGFNEPPINWTRRLARDGLLPRPLPPGRRPGFGSRWVDRDGPHDVRSDAQKIADQAFFEEGLKELDKLFDQVRGPSEPPSSWVRDWKTFKKEVGNDPPAFLSKVIEKTIEDVKKNITKFDQDIQKYSEEWLNHQKRRLASKETSEGERRFFEQCRWWEEQQQEQQQQPSNETDLFDLVRSTVAQADKTFNNFTKSVMESPQKPLNENATPEIPLPSGNHQIMRNGPTTTRTEETDESGGKTIRSESHWIDGAGYVHKDVEVLKMDANGRVVGQENRSHVTLQSQTRSPGDIFTADVTTNSTSSSHSEHQTSSSSKSDDGKSTGWFWR